MPAEFNGHQRNDAGITASVDDMGDEFNQQGKNLFVHERFQYKGRFARLKRNGQGAAARKSSCTRLHFSFVRMRCTCSTKFRRSAWLIFPLFR